MQYLGRDSTILVITPRVTEELAVTLSVMKEAGYSINLFVIGSEEGYFDAVEKLAPRGIDTYQIRDPGHIAKFATHDIYY